MKTILVTGGAGYVGSVLLRVLLKEGYRVVCVDKLMFGGESIIDIWHEPNFVFHKCDICDYPAFDQLLEIEKYDAIIHLAAIVGDPACKLEHDLALRVNWEASKHLVNRAIEIKTSRFVFASTCSNYGKVIDPLAFVDETSPLSPVSFYAELKVKFEKYILEGISLRKDFFPVSLRFATVYGLSPRMRFDLTINEFAKEVALGHELIVYGEHYWRPYCHVRDFSNAIVTVLKAPQEKIAFKAFNVGDTLENYTKKMIVDKIKNIIPNASIKYINQIDDPRNYRVNCDLIKRELDFSTTRILPQGIREIIDVVQMGVIVNPEQQKYYNIPHGAIVE